MNPFSVSCRQENIQKMANQYFDIAIIGGGINGAGVARDAASRGMKVALVEANDFAFGTSSRSSKLIHGGIRYLENLEFGLVFEALSERRRLLVMAPHLVHPLKFILPVYRGAKHSLFKLGCGMWLYDLLSLFEAPEMHERLSPSDTVERVPIIKLKDLTGAFSYYDAYMDDDRLVLETLRSAHQYGALCSHYTEVVNVTTNDSGKITSLICRDKIHKQGFSVRARHYVSTVGPWTDFFGKNLFHDWKTVLRPTKGIHLTVSNHRLPLKDAVVMPVDHQDRIVFAIPRHEMVLIGTTDTDFNSQPSTVRADFEEVEYLLRVANNYFPGAKLVRADIMSSFAGVRPLVADGASTEAKTSREHTIWHDPHGITFVAGGKYTTYRHIAQQVVHEVLQSFSLVDQTRFLHSLTLGPLNPSADVGQLERARAHSPQWSLDYNLPLSTVIALVDRHGMEVPTLIENYISSAGRPIQPNVAPWILEAGYSIEHTMCLSLVDYYRRRTPLFLSLPDHGLRWVDSIANIFSQHLGWTDSHRQNEIDQLRSFIASEMSWKTA